MGPLATPSLDHRGRSITTFVVFDAAAALAPLESGATIEIVTDEFEPFEHDLAAWCRAAGHVLKLSEATPHGHRFVIEKGIAPERTHSMAMVISTDALDALLSPLGFALAAALEGSDVHLYFQGPGVRVLTRGHRPRLHGWARPFSRFAAAGMAKAGHIAPLDKLRQLRSLGAKIYVCGGSLQPFKVQVDDLVFDDLPIIEYLSFVPVMVSATVQLYV